MNTVGTPSAGNSRESFPSSGPHGFRKFSSEFLQTDAAVGDIEREAAEERSTILANDTGIEGRGGGADLGAGIAPVSPLFIPQTMCAASGRHGSVSSRYPDFESFSVRHAALEDHYVLQAGRPGNSTRTASPLHPLRGPDPFQLAGSSQYPSSTADVFGSQPQISSSFLATMTSSHYIERGPLTDAWPQTQSFPCTDTVLPCLTDAPNSLLHINLGHRPTRPIGGSIKFGEGSSPTVPISSPMTLWENSGTVRAAQPVRGFTLPTEFSKGSPLVSRPNPFIGITKRSKTQRWEAHIWVPEKKQQVYLGNFSTDERAATAYDIAALKVRREGGKTNFPAARYTKMMDMIERFQLEDIVRLVRRQSQGFGRGKCSYRGVTKHSNGTWEARIGVPKKHRNIYIGLFSEVEQAAKAYDEAMMRMKGAKMSTNFLQNRYTKEIEEHNILVNVLGPVDCVYILYFTEERPAFTKWIQKGGSPWIEKLKGFCEDNREKILVLAGKAT